MKTKLFSLFMFSIFGLFQLSAQLASPSDAIISSFPYMQDFGEQTDCLEFEGNSIISCNFQEFQARTPRNTCHLDSLPGWLNVDSILGVDSIEWAVYSDFNFRPGTGPSFDHTTLSPISGDGTCMLMRTECNPRNAILQSPSIVLNPDSIDNMHLRFWTHMFGADATMGSVFVNISDDGGTSFAPLDTVRPDVFDDEWKETVINLSSYLGSTIIVRFEASIPDLNGELPDLIGLDDVLFTELPGNDAGIASIDLASSIIAGPNDVDVTITNFGTEVLTTATIGWSVDGATQTPVNWTGSLGFGESVSAGVLGSFNFTAGAHTVRSWTMSPNGQADGNTLNDTIEKLICTPLTGDFSLDLSGAGDFSSLAELSDALSSCGIVSNVTINVSPGTYTGTLYLDNVSGTSSTSTITINGGNASSVTFNGGSTLFGSVVVDGTDWVTVKNITLELNPIPQFRSMIALTGNVSNVTVDSCSFLATPGNPTAGVISTSNPTINVSPASGENASNSTVSNCHFFGINDAIVFRGDLNSTDSLAGYDDKNSFLNNTMDSCNTAIDARDQDSLVVTGNNVTNLTAFLNNNRGILNFSNVANFNISSNVVVNAPGNALRINDANFAAEIGENTNATGLVSNNMLSTSEFTSTIRLNNIEHTDFFNNSVYGIGTAMSLNGPYFCDIRNNILASTAGAAFTTDFLPVRIDTMTELAVGTNWTANFNLYYSRNDSSFNLLVQAQDFVFSNLAALQAGLPNENINSIEGNPSFVADGIDLHIDSLSIAASAGDPSVGITTDIDGEDRTGSFEIGADEFPTMGTIPGDLDFDCDVDVDDLLTVIGDFGCMGFDCVGDTDGDGDVDVDDLLTVIGAFNNVCP